MQALPLTAKFFLLSMDRYKATFAHWHHFTSFEIGISGALVFEFLLAKRLVLSENKEFFEDKNVPVAPLWAEKILQEIEEKHWFKMLLGKKHEKTLGNWLKVVKTQSLTIKENIKKDLKVQAILVEKPAKLLGITVSHTTYLKETNILVSLKEDIEQAILGKKTPDLETLMLLRLIKGTKTIKLIFSEKSIAEQKKLEQELDALFQKEEITAILSELLAESRQREAVDDALDLSDALEAIAEVIDSIGDAVDGGSGDSGGDGGGGDGGGD